MQSILFSANIILPSFLLILLGRVITMKNVITRREMDKVAKLSFSYFLPVKVFVSVASNDAGAFSNYQMAIFCCAVMVLGFLVAWFIAAHTLSKKDSIGSFVQACFRGSFTVIGLTMVEAYAGTEGVARCSLLLSMTVVFLNVLAIIILTYRNNDGSIGFRMIHMAKTLITNPFIIASLLGILASYGQVEFPYIIDETLNRVAEVASPLSLMCIGSSLSMHAVKDSLKYASISAFVKTFGMGIFSVGLAFLLGFRGFELAVITFFFTAPNPPGAYIMALVYDNDSDLASASILISTVLSMFASMLLITGLRTQGYI